MTPEEIEIRKLHESDRDQHMTDLTAAVIEGGEKIQPILGILFPNLKKLRDSGDYAAYIVFGTTIIEYYLKKLVSIYTHAINYNLRRIEEIYPESYLHDLNVDTGNRATAGNLPDKLCTTFKFDKKHPKEYKLLKKLVDERNRIAHQLITEYDGDLRKLNAELKSYAENEPVEKGFIAIVEIQAPINQDLVSKRLGQNDKPKSPSTEE